MKIDVCLTAIDLNKQYLLQLPITKLFWNEVIGIPFKVILIANKIPKHFEYYKDDIILFPPIPKIHTAFQAQCVRLLYPALMKEYKNSILISDIDLIPLSKKFFLELPKNIRSNNFIYYRSAYLKNKMIGILNVAAAQKTWKEIFSVRNEKDIRKILKSWYSKDYTTRKGNPTWYTDQKMLYKYVIDWNKKTNRFIHLNDKKTKFRNYDFKRFDPYKNFVDNQKRNLILEDMKNEIYYWIHSPKNFPKKFYCLIEIANKIKEKENVNKKIIDKEMKNIIELLKKYNKIPTLRLKDYKLGFFKNTLKQFMKQLVNYYKINYEPRKMPSIILSNKVAVIVEPRKHPYLETVIRNVISNLSEDWGLMIFHGTQNEVFIQKIISKLKLDTESKNNILLQNLNEENLTIEKYTNLLKSVDFWEKIPAEHVLIFQTDGLILQKTDLQEYLEYDYIGAPWKAGISCCNLIIKQIPSLSKLVPMIGNGGMSLRKRSSMIELCKKYSKPYEEDKLHEDIFFIVNLLKNNKKLPTIDIAKTFSVEGIYYPTPKMIHKPIAHLEPTQFINLLTSIDKNYKWKFY